MLSISGLAAYFLLYGSVITGMMLSSPSLRKHLSIFPRAWTAHQLLSLAGIGAAALHTAQGVFLPQGNRLLVLAFLNPGVPLGLGLALGVSALYATVVATAAFYLRVRIGSTLWRGLHALAYPAFAVAAWHSLEIGANAWLPALRFTYTITLASAGLLVCGRLFETALHARAAA